MEIDIDSKEYRTYYTLKELFSQAKKGGVKESNRPAGNYWSKKTWENYCNNVRDVLKGCGHSKPEIEQKITEATSKVVFVD